MSKYVVRNCPCLFNSYYASGKTVRFECNDGNHDDKLCRDVTDCLIKRVIDKCKEAIKTYDNEEFYEDEADIFMGESNMASNILDMFDIQEVEE